MAGYLGAGNCEVNLSGCLILVIAVVFVIGFWRYLQQHKKPAVPTVTVASRDVVVQNKNLIFPGQTYTPTGREEVHSNFLKSGAAVIPLPASGFQVAPVQQQYVIVRWIPYEARAYFSYFSQPSAEERLVQLIADSYKVQPYLNEHALNKLYQGLMGVTFLPIVPPQGYGPPPPVKPGLPPVKPTDADRFVQRFTEIINNTKTLTEAERAWREHKRTMPNHFDANGDATDEIGDTYDRMMSTHFVSFKDKL